MSDYELLSLYTETIDLFFTITTVLTTILFSYIAGMFLIVRQIHWSLAVILSGLFAIVMYALASGLVATGTRAASMGAEIERRIAATGSAIDWLAARLIPAGIANAFFYFFVAATLLALVFAFVVRRSESTA